MSEHTASTSEPTHASPAGETERARPERQTAAERRGQETVVISQDLLAQARAATPAPEPVAPSTPAAAVAPPTPEAPLATPSPAPAETPASAPTASRGFAMIAGVLLVLIVVAAVIAYALLK